MDPLRLLSRSTKVNNNKASKSSHATPSSGQNAEPQLFPHSSHPTTSKKRKRGSDAPTISDDSPGGLDFFGVSSKATKQLGPAMTAQKEDDFERFDETDNAGRDGLVKSHLDLPEDQAKAILKQHKLKVAWINPEQLAKKDRKKVKSQEKAKKAKTLLYPQPLQSFQHLRTKFALSSRLSSNIAEQGYDAPTEVQLGALPLLLEKPGRLLTGFASEKDAHQQELDLLTVAPTGSGKTLAFMIPLLHKIQGLRHENISRDETLAVVLAPTKELAGQIVNEGRKLANATGIRITQLKKGMRLPNSHSQNGDRIDNSVQPVVKANVIVSTPGLLHSMLHESASVESRTLPNARHLVLDEADVLLDPLFRDQTLGVWNALTHPELRVSLWSATMGSNIEELARSTIDKRREELGTKIGRSVAEAPLIRLVVGLKDSAVPNIDHRLIYAASEQGKLMGLRQLLHPTSTSKEAGPPLLPPFLVFTQTIERAVALHSELLYDIPAEAGGISRIAVLHSDLSDTARDSVMTRFRKGEIWVLITTDLLSRGVDFRGVNGVVNYDIPTSSAAYVHRVGRTGRAGREGGVAVTLYSQEDIPYLKHVANVVVMAQKQTGAPEGGGMQQWLLDALPSLSKQEKQKLKKRGIESRSSRGKASDPKAARKARISSKSGFVRKEENKRKGAVAGSKRRQQADAVSDAGDGSDFDGFD